MEEITKFELKKNSDELKAIEFADKITNELLIECSIKPYFFLEKDIHIFPIEFYKKTTGSGSAGRADHISQTIILNASKVRGKGNLRFANIVFHEMLHIKSKSILRKDKDGEMILCTRVLETNLVRNNHDKNEIYPRLHGSFGGLNEAIVSYYEKYFVSEALEDDLFGEEKEWLDSDEAKEFKRKIAQENNISESEIYTVNKNGTWGVYSYPLQRKVLEKIVSKIYRDNVKEFNSEKEVMTTFLKAMLVSDTSNLFNLIEKSFSHESLKILGEMKENNQSAVETFNYFSL